ncbi:MAG: PAS domain S-box protein [Desulfobulbaceae bacterium]|nr:PAS domain S-box protein [Desulfobulbaceae bacterium]
MTEIGQPDEITRLTPEERARKLALEKSYLQLVIRLMSRVGGATRLDDTIEALLRNILDVIGGTNITLYYYIDQQLLVADVYGRRESLAAPDDPLVQQVFAGGEPLELESAFADSAMQTPEFGKAYSWLYPLKVGEEVLGVFRLENLNLAMRDLAAYLPLFFNYTAQVLRNEIRSKSRLQQANEQLAAANSELRESNARLAEEIRKRNEAESSLRITQFSVDHASDCLFWIRPDASFANVNDSTCRRLGYSREELLALTVFDVDPAFPRAAWDAHWLEIKKRRSFTIETQHRTKSGEVFPVEVTLNYVEYQGAEYNFAFARDIVERKRAEESLKTSNEQLQLKLETLLTPEVELTEQELGNVIDSRAIQAMLQDFTTLTGMVTAIVDLHGKILIATGWQDLCSKFHRVHPETAGYCRESDLFLAEKVEAGEYVTYQCKNGLWDVVTPLFIGGKHLGNIYTGQFFYEDAPPDLKLFEAQAERYGFDKKRYMEALQRVPLVSRERVRTMMHFLVAFAEMTSKLSYGNLKLAKAILENKRIEDALRISKAVLEDSVMARTAALCQANAQLQLELEQRARVEEALKLTQFAMDSTADVVFWLRQDGTYFYANRAASDLLGYTAAEFQTMKVADVNPEHQDDVWQRHWRELQEQRVLRFESTLYKKDGSPVPVEIAANFVEFQDQAYNCAFVRDITESKKAAKALRESEAFLDSVLENVPNMLFVKDAKELRFVRFNKAGEELLGYRREDLYGKNDYDFFPPAEAEFFIEKDREVLAAKKLVDIPEEQIETRHQGKRLLHTRKIPIINAQGVPEFLVGISEDITERKRAEDESRRSAVEWSAAMDASEDVIYLLDLKRRIIRANKAFYQLTGTTPETALGRHIVELIHPGGEVVPCPICAAQEEKRDLLLTLEVDHPDNPAGRPIEVMLRIVRDEEGRQMSMLMTLHDLSHERQVQEELTKYREHLEELVKERTAEIAGKTAELERMNKLFVGRELRMVELKERIKELERKL